MLIYIREAHAIDSPVPMEFGLVEDPVTDVERQTLATRTCTELELPMQAVVDGIDDAVNLAYHAWPERLYVIDKDGRIAWVGGPGPFEFDPDAWEKAIERVVHSRK